MKSVGGNSKNDITKLKLLQEIDISDQSDNSFPDAFSPVINTKIKARKVSNTYPHYLSEQKREDQRSFPSGTENSNRSDMDKVFKEKALALKRLRSSLVQEMNDMTEEDLATSWIAVLERDLDRIRDFRNRYQDVDKLYSAWFKIFRDTIVPPLIPQPKWFRIDHDLKV